MPVNSVCDSLRKLNIACYKVKPVWWELLLCMQLFFSPNFFRTYQQVGAPICRLYIHRLSKPTSRYNFKKIMTLKLPTEIEWTTNLLDAVVYDLRIFGQSYLLWAVYLLLIDNSRSTPLFHQLLQIDKKDLMTAHMMLIIVFSSFTFGDCSFDCDETEDFRHTWENFCSPNSHRHKKKRRKTSWCLCNSTEHQVLWILKETRIRKVPEATGGLLV